MSQWDKGKVSIVFPFECVYFLMEVLHGMNGCSEHPTVAGLKKKIESKCNKKFGDCQTMFESDLTVSQMPNFHYLTIEIHILKSLSIRTGRKSKISVSRT